MRYYRCKCGKSTAFGSMSPDRCARCTDCGSDLAEGSALHREPESHLMVPRSVETDEGTATLTRCKWCLRTREQLTKLGEPMEDAQ